MDWFLPVGDYIDGLNEDGWIRTASFTGWKSLVIEYFYSSTVTDYGVYPIFGPFQIYRRDKCIGHLLETFDPPVWSEEFRNLRKRPRSGDPPEIRKHKKLISKLKRKIDIKENGYDPWKHSSSARQLREFDNDELINVNSWVPPTDEQWRHSMYLGLPSYKKLLTRGAPRLK